MCSYFSGQAKVGKKALCFMLPRAKPALFLQAIASQFALYFQCAT
jgi:hypothetical protein